MIIYDYSKLLGKIIEKFGNKSNFASKMKLSERTISLKLNNKVEFKQKEIVNACELLDIPIEQMYIYFFMEREFKDIEQN